VRVEISHYSCLYCTSCLHILASSQRKMVYATIAAATAANGGYMGAVSASTVSQLL
jgi:hypothetical protein